MAINEVLYNQPIGKVLSYTGKKFLMVLNEKLSYLDIDRAYYALILIEQGQENLTQNDLANQLETDKVSVARIIDYLVKKGYVQRAKSLSDRRKYYLILSERAINELPGIKNSVEAVTAIAFDGLSQSQKNEFLMTLGTIKNNLRKAKNNRL